MKIATARSAERTKAKLENTSESIFVHGPSSCEGDICCLHNRTNHPMRSWPQYYRDDRGIMERVCPCGVGHPDPDDRRIRLGLDEGDHGCCGCCAMVPKEP